MEEEEILKKIEERISFFVSEKFKFDNFPKVWTKENLKYNSILKNKLKSYKLVYEDLKE